MCIFRKDGEVESDNELAKCMMERHVSRIHVLTQLRPP
jgi:hypothetical protein